MSDDADVEFSYGETLDPNPELGLFEKLELLFDELANGPVTRARAVEAFNRHVQAHARIFEDELASKN